MVAIHIGRFSVDCPTDVTLDGDRVTFSGEQRADAAVGLARRAQCIGLVRDLDDPVTAVVADELDSSLNGFYRVVGAAAQPLVGRAYRTTADPDEGTFTWSVTLERLRSTFTNPLLEVHTVAQLIANDHTITAPTDHTIISVPDNTQNAGADYTGIPSSNRSGAGLGGIDGASYSLNTSSNMSDFSGVVSYIADPATYYSTPACRFEIKVGGSWYPIPGRNIPDGIQAWRMHNGHAVLSSDTTDSDALAVGAVDAAGTDFADFELLAGRVSTGTFTPSNSSAPKFRDEGPFLLRNSPDLVVVRTRSMAETFTWVLRRGHMFVTLHTYNPGGNVRGLGTADTGEDGTAITGGVIADDTRGDSSNLVLVCSTSEDVALTNRTGISEDSGTDTSALYALGLSRNVSSGNTGHYDSFLEMFLGNTQFTTRVVIR